MLQHLERLGARYDELDRSESQGISRRLPRSSVGSRSWFRSASGDISQLPGDPDRLVRFVVKAFNDNDIALKVKTSLINTNINARIQKKYLKKKN